MVNIALNVPLDVWQEHVSPFLTLKHFVAVDTALSSLRQRQAYHIRIRTHISSMILSFEAARWIQVVGVLLKQIVFDDRMTDEQLSQLHLFGLQAEMQAPVMRVHQKFCAQQRTGEGIATQELCSFKCHVDGYRRDLHCSDVSPTGGTLVYGRLEVHCLLFSWLAFPSAAERWLSHRRRHAEPA